jgi:hypothetical protein
VQYALQRRNDERAAKAPPVVVMAAVRFLAASGASSLLDRTRQEWRDHPGRPQKQAVTQLAWFRAQIADLAEGTSATHGRCTVSDTAPGASWTSPASRSRS